MVSDYEINLIEDLQEELDAVNDLVGRGKDKNESEFNRISNYVEITKIINFVKLVERVQNRILNPLLHGIDKEQEESLKESYPDFLKPKEGKEKKLMDENKLINFDDASEETKEKITNLIFNKYQTGNVYQVYKLQPIISKEYGIAIQQKRMMELIRDEMTRDS